MFVLGFFCGWMLGGTIGAVIMAAMCAGKLAAGREAPRVDNKPISDNHTHQPDFHELNEIVTHFGPKRGVCSACSTARRPSRKTR
jgi:hypothetical protein